VEEIAMAEFNLMINEQERSELLRILRDYLGQTRVEVHHTHTPGYRENVKHEEEVIRGLLQRLQSEAGVGTAADVR
jgi:hypothetical protein